MPRWRDLEVPDSADAIDTLRTQVFASVDGACLTDAALVDLYRPDVGDPVPTLALAHIVACAGCLDRLNRHLGLSPLAMRDPTEMTSTRSWRDGAPPNDGSAPPPSGVDGDAGEPPRAESPRTAREAFAGPPHEANGRDDDLGERDQRDEVAVCSRAAERRTVERLLQRTHDTLASVADHPTPTPDLRRASSRCSHGVARGSRGRRTSIHNTLPVRITALPASASTKNSPQAGPLTPQ